MKYETKNNLGIFLLILGSIAVVLLLFLSPLASFWAWLLMLAAIATVLFGFYLMTRSFGKADVDHPDYAQYQARVEAAKADELNK